MDITRVNRPALLSWLAVGLLAGSCCVLAVLQYRWITEFSVAERDRLHEELQSRLNLLARSFNDEISNAFSALTPPADQIDELGRQPAYAARYENWRQSHEPLFRRIALAIPEDQDVVLWNLDLQTSQFERVEWPPEWDPERARLRAGPGRGRALPIPPETPALLELPRFGGGRGEPGRGGEGGGEQEWLLAELNLDYLGATLLPDLLNKYVSDAGKLNYQAQVVLSADPSVVIYQSASDHAWSGPAADASVSLFDIQPGIRGFRDGPGPGRGGGRSGSFGFRDRGRGPPGPPSPPGGRPGPLTSFGQGRWRLLVRHHAGSLETLVAQARWRNIAISAGLLLLILATIAVLVRVSRQSQRLAEVQMNFVASVSHELRTPLTVIRTAAFNLRGRLANRPDQVEKYGKLIQEESEKLTALVEQALRFASGAAGHAIREREPVPIEALINESLDASRESLEASGIVLEKRFQPGLPPVLADKLAMKHALQNIIENALKYGVGDSRWVGVFAAVIMEKTGPAVEIRVVDRGPGIPEEEQTQIFDPFFRGRRAVADQLHGTGLGLSLVKSIIEAHGGSICVHSEPMNRTEFIVRIPAAPTELQHEFAHSLS